MAYSQEEKDECFDYIISEIESGKSLRYALNTNGMPSSRTFFQWLDVREKSGALTEEAQEKVKRYACACETRELILLDEILEIADKQDADVIVTDDGIITNHNIIQRNKLQIEARQWVLGKLRPEKYGNKTVNENKNINIDAGKLTDEEIKNALEEEAVKRRFKEGVRFKNILTGCVGIGTIKARGNYFEFKESKNQLWFSEIGCVFNNGTWATIIKPKQMTVQEIEKELGYEIEIV